MGDDITTNWLLLSVIPLIIVGFIFRVNTFFIITFAAIYSGLVGKFDIEHTIIYNITKQINLQNLYEVISNIGQIFANNLYVGIVWLILPLLAILERYGLKKQAENIINKFKVATTGKILIVYFTFRQITAALGLLSLGGQARTVRPLVSPMAEAAAKVKYKNLKYEDSQKIRAHAAASENVSVFFGEDIFISVHSILLIVAFYKEGYGIELEPIHLAKWAIPTAIVAYIVHCSRLCLFDKYLDKKYKGVVD